MKLKQIGITGGIGSGKSVVCRVLKTMGYPVFDADSIAKSILNSDAVKPAVKALIGDGAYKHEKANREFIASVVFNNPVKLEGLNKIIHPAVQKHYLGWVNEQHNKELVFKEAAIMFESGSYREMDHIIAVTAPLEIRLNRTMIRDGKKRDQVMKIVSQQLSESELVQRSDFIIVNDDRTPVMPQIFTIMHKILNK